MIIVEKFLQNFDFNYIVIDTEYLSPEEVADIVMQNIELMNSKKLLKERN